MSKQTSIKRNSKSRNTQLLDVMSLPADEKTMKTELAQRIIFEKVIEGTVPNSTPEIKFSRISYSITNPDGSEGELVFSTDRCFSFGVSEGKDPATGTLHSYSIAMSMYDRDGATERQTRTVTFLNVLTELTKEHLLKDDIKDQHGKYDLVLSDLRKLNPLYLKKEKGKVVEGASPSFYPKLIYFKAGKDKNGKDREERVLTKFYSEDEVDESGEQLQINPMDFIGQKCYVTAAVKIEGIFIGSKINIQCKVYEANIKAAETGPKRLLKISSNITPTTINKIPK